MKKVDEYTLEELMGLIEDDEEKAVEKLVDIEIAHRGIIPVEEPDITTVTKIDLEKTEMGWKIGGIIFDNEDDALVVSKMKVYSEEYDYNIGYDYKYMKKVDSHIHREYFYNHVALTKLANKIKQEKEAEEENETKLKEYKDYEKAIYDARSYVNGFINEAASLRNRINKAKEVFQKYLNLADNNVTTAKQFFNNTYKDQEDILEQFKEV